MTVAHLAIAESVHRQLGAGSVDLVISRIALAKEHRQASPVEERLAAIAGLREPGRRWLRARATEAQLLADIAEGYDVLVVGADKWHQLLDPGFYGSVAARDRALARLPRVAVAPRSGVVLPGAGRDDLDVVVLDVPEHVRHVSATAVREGRDDWRA